MNYFTPLALAGLLMTVTPLQAETISIPLGQQAGAGIQSLPAHGTSRAMVSQRYGEPVTRHAAVGQPPISRWDYPGFSVYFEYDHVVHSVRQYSPTSK